MNVYNPFEVEFDYLPVVNFAMQQNNVNIVRRFIVTNKSRKIIRNVKITFTPDPLFFDTDPYVIDVIQPEESIRLDTISFHLKTSLLFQVTERLSGHFRMEISGEEGGTFFATYPITLLAYDEWGGSRVLPEMLAAFSTPNHPAVFTILKRASELLQVWTGNPSLDKYFSRNPDRVKKQMAAIYSAITEQQIVYAALPASFEREGQRVRMIDNLFSNKMGNCLEMTLLYTACLEAVGIHPIIVLTEGHAFAGGWLIEETFPDILTDDVSFLTKRTADGINEILLVEATCMNKSNGSGFDAAIQVANNNLVDVSKFHYALDIKRIRLSGIKPLPHRVKEGNEWVIRYDDVALNSETEPALQELIPTDLSLMEQEIELTKQVLWERKLLDLSLRNNLLNLRITKNTLQLISPDPGYFEDALADGKEFRVFPFFQDWEKLEYTRELKHISEMNDQRIQLIKNELASNRLRSYLSENELKNALQHLYRSSRLSMEENGANTLYLALGFLKWYETSASEKPRYAPILLLPVEIIRKASAGGYIIRSREEETLMNITLLEMLRQNHGIVIPGLDPLPVDDSGVNVNLIYSIIRTAIKEQPRWDVDEQAVLGIFSFNKFIMWNDIHHNAEKLIRNDIVFSLMNGKLEWEAQDVLTDASVLDKELTPADILLPIGADSSQLEAIYEAVEGKSFILHGPPGTGKSQTITNIIVNALYRGKRVLFVAEKMAALSVVQSRLTSLGLDPFCMELHSNKSKKSTVMEQLKKTSEVIRYKSPQQFEKEAARLHELRVELNTYIDALHTTYPFGLSMYEAITQYLASEVLQEVDFPVSLLEEATADIYEKWENVIEGMMNVGKTFGHPGKHPLKGIDIREYSASVKEEGVDALRNLIQTLTQLKERQPDFALVIGDTIGQSGKKQLDFVRELLDILLRIPELTPSLLNQPALHNVLEEYAEVVIHGREKDRLKKEIKNIFTEEVLAAPARSWLAAWTEYEGKWFLPKFFGQRRIRKEIKKYTLTQTITPQQISQLLPLIIRFQEEEAFLETYKYDLPSYFGKIARHNREEWDVIEKIIEDTKELNYLILLYAKDIHQATSLKEHLSRQMNQGIYSFRSMYGDVLHTLNELLNSFNNENERLDTYWKTDQEFLYGDASNQWLDTALLRLNNWLNHAERLKDWYQWLLSYRQVQQQGLGFFADAYRDKPFSTEEVVEIFRKSYRKACIRYIFNKNPQLELFNGDLFETVIHKYRELNQKFEELTRKELYARLATGIPSFTQEASQNSEVGILQKNIRNNARGMSIRRLFDQIPTLLERMVPCMLMSPISVAQYIDPDADPFDLVIFDEASQMPTYEAVGAIARGKHVIIVGDPKQMPPTSFFSVNQTDEDNIEMEDLESILDDCLSLSMPSKHLLWHYRSKHESLIAFSNSEYYDNKLLTFPSPDNQETKVRAVSVDGFYDKGKSRQNKSEAQAVIKEIVRRLSDAELRNRSIGVVTFSSVQQTLIEDMLSEYFDSHPELEKIANESAEPLFIKNLENVQGDERDIILFSVGYGPDVEGKVSMNFGPLNRTGGERRLNVAVSRARYEMIIFSTLRSDMIDLNRTSSVGVAGLKRFLEYAEKGQRAYNLQRIGMVTNAGVESLIASVLEKEGYTVHTNIGCSGYKIDIGIVDKDSPSRYILGILCDGENYRSTKTARDREIVQNRVLQLLGWNICRVWTLDWFEDSDKVIKSIRKAIEEAIMNEQLKNQQRAFTPAEEVIQEPLDTSETEDEEVEEEMITDIVESDNIQPYQPVLFNTNDPATSIYLEETEKLVFSRMKRVLQTEAPISRSLFIKRIRQAWHIVNKTEKMDKRLQELLDKFPVYTSVHDDLEYFWIDENQCQEYKIFRPSSEREAADLPPEEVANGVRHILQQQISLPMPDLVKVTAQLFGFARSGPNIEAAMFRGIQEAARRDYIKFQNGRMVIK